MAALGATSAGAATAKRILNATVTAGTADGYMRNWLAFQDFCAANDWPALPTSAAAVACYYGAMCDRGLKPSTMRAYLTAVNNMHAAAGYARPALGPAVAKLRKGWARILADRTNALPPARGALPAPAMWQIVALAGRTADAHARRQYTAVLLAFLVSRRTSEVLELQMQDISKTTAGGVHIEVARFKHAEGRDAPTRLVYDIPRDPSLAVDPVIDLLYVMLDELAAEPAPPNRLIFSTPAVNRPPSTDDLSRWLRHGLAALGVSPPPGVLYSSYSCRAGGATALYLCGLPVFAVAAMLGHKGNDPRTAMAEYVDVLAPASPEAIFLCGRWRQGLVNPRA